MSSIQAARFLLPLIVLIPSRPPLQAPPALEFRESSDEAGLAVRHPGGAPEKRYYVEAVGSGACWLDHDLDGHIDLYVVNSGDAEGDVLDGTSRLFRNEGGGRFLDITDEAGVGIGGPGISGMGCAVADIDNDGFPDLYLTNAGPNILFRNRGDGTFVDTTAAAGVGESRWSASAGFSDFDADGDLDLFVVNHLEFSASLHGPCGEPEHPDPYCDPDMFSGVTDVLYRNEGDGTFLDVSAMAGVAGSGGRGLSLALADFNQDGWQDIYVANHGSANFLYINQQDGTFRDVTVSGGAGFSEDGFAQGGLGTDAADVNGDLRMDIVVTNMNLETNELYLNAGPVFNDASYGSGVGAPGFGHQGFGVDLLDYDNDRDSDLLIVNGYWNRGSVESTSTSRSRSLMENDGDGHFREVGDGLGEAFQEPSDGRGLAVGDIDNDGDLDFFVVNRSEQGDLFLNEGGNDPARGGGNWLILRLVGVGSNRDGIGARVSVVSESCPAGDMRWQMDEVRAGSGYLSGNDVRLHFGLGDATEAERIDIAWPSGLVQTLHSLRANQILTILEGEVQATLPRELQRTVSRSACLPR